MRVGYPVFNLEFEPEGEDLRVVSYARERVFEVLAENLELLRRTLTYNVEHGILFFRIRADLVPYATHRRCRGYDWEREFRDELAALGRYIGAHGVRINVHPDLFTALSYPGEKQTASSIADLEYQCRVLDALGLDHNAKIQLHVGEAHGDAAAAVRRFITRFRALDPHLRRRVVLENDNVFCPFALCRRIHDETGVPLVYDVLHHEVDGRGESVPELLAAAEQTWSPEDGLPMVDYSSQLTGRMPGRHARQLDEAHFRSFIAQSRGFDFDLMLELKDRQQSALRALELLSDDPRLVTGR